MTADAGLIRTDEEATVILGSRSGAYSTVVLKLSNTHDFFDLKIKDIFCRPRL